GSARLLQASRSAACSKSKSTLTAGLSTALTEQARTGVRITKLKRRRMAALLRNGQDPIPVRSAWISAWPLLGEYVILAGRRSHGWPSGAGAGRVVRRTPTGRSVRYGLNSRPCGPENAKAGWSETSRLLWDSSKTQWNAWRLSGFKN